MSNRRRKRVRGGIAAALPDMAALVASAGSHGDTMLAHINPREAGILKAAGGSGTVNPRTGLRQFYDTGGQGGAEQGKDMGGAGNGAGGQGGGNGGNVGNGGINNGAQNESSFDDQQSAMPNNATPGPANAPSYDSRYDPNALSFENSVMGFFGQNHQPENATMGKSAAPDPGTYGGFFGSGAAYGAIGLAGGILGGPAGSMAAKGGYSLARGDDMQTAMTHAVGSTVGGIASAVANGKGVGVSNATSNAGGIGNGAGNDVDAVHYITQPNDLGVGLMGLSAANGGRIGLASGGNVPSINLAQFQNAGLPTLGADAMRANVSGIGNYVAQQRAQSVADGLLDPNTGMPTPAGMRAAGQAYAGGMSDGGVGGMVGGIKAYHGSPHSFSAFDNAAIGTGEGAQAYGHGLYFAENEGVARGYRDALTQHATDSLYTPEGAVKRALTSASSPEEAMQYLQQDLKGAQASEAQGYKLKFGGSDKYASAIDLLKSGYTGNGHMYEVNLNANPDHFLDWDKPLSEQHPVVQDALKSVMAPDMVQSRLQYLSDKGHDPSDFFGSMKGSFGYSLATDGTGSPATATASLQQAGIPGIRYLDGGSRGAGEGTSNYVAFDPATIEIMRKYGAAGMVGTGAAAGADASSDPQSGIAGAASSDDPPQYASGGKVAGVAANASNMHKFTKGSGLFPGSAPGRADTLNTMLPSGGHVIPADVVSGMGQGNTTAGAAKIQQMIAGAPKTPRMANGGAVPVKVSSGEFYVHPSHVAAIGGGDLDAGHAKLRKMAANVRAGAVRHAQTVDAPR